MAFGIQIKMASEADLRTIKCQFLEIWLFINVEQILYVLDEILISLWIPF